MLNNMVICCDSPLLIVVHLQWKFWECCACFCMLSILWHCNAV